MPPPHRHRPHRPLDRAPASAVASLIRPEAVERLLTPWIPDAEERAFVVRCMIGEGPIHHRGASYALLLLLGQLLERVDPPGTLEPQPASIGHDGGSAADSTPVPLRLPPHTTPRGDGDHHYPLRMPTAPLERIAPKGSPELAVLVDCLLDGPPHHALANAAMVCLLDALLRRADGGA